MAHQPTARDLDASQKQHFYSITSSSIARSGGGILQAERIGGPQLRQTRLCVDSYPADRLGNFSFEESRRRIIPPTICVAKVASVAHQAAPRLKSR